MGRGNFSPRTNQPFRMVYVTLNNDSDLDSDFSNEFEYENFKECLLSLLPSSFYDGLTKIQDWHASGFCTLKRPTDWGNCALLLSANRLFDLGIADDEHSVAVFLVVRDDAPAFAASKLDAAADKLFDKLNEYYELRVRAGAWCSGPYIPSK